MSHSFKIVSFILKAAKSQDMSLVVKAQGPISLPTLSPEPLAKAVKWQYNFINSVLFLTNILNVELLHIPKAFT